MGLVLSLAGRPAEAEPCLRKALAEGANLTASERAPILISLGCALMDMGRYQESRACLDEALKMSGDPTGSCRASQAQWLLLQGLDPQQALELTDQALEARARIGAAPLGSNPRIGSTFVPRALVEGNLVTLWAQKAWALAQMGRQEESQAAVDAALQLGDATYGGLQNCSMWSVGYSRFTGPGVRRIADALLSNTCWFTGMALVCMSQTGNAGEHFKIGGAAGARNKYGALCRKQLEKLGAAGTAETR